jgi:hypothetical protein
MPLSYQNPDRNATLGVVLSSVSLYNRNACAMRREGGGVRCGSEIGQFHS